MLAGAQVCDRRTSCEWSRREAWHILGCFKVTLKDLNGGEIPVTIASGENPIDRLGGEFKEIDRDLASKLDIEGGVQVVSLDKGILQDDTNMREGFIITSVNDSKVTSLDDLEDALESRQGGVMLEGVYENLPGIYYYAFGLNQ